RGSLGDQAPAGGVADQPTGVVARVRRGGTAASFVTAAGLTADTLRVYARCPLGREPGHGINRRSFGAAWSDLEVQVRAGGVAGHAHVGDVLTRGDLVPDED